MITSTAIRTAIAAKLNTVVGIGKVQDYERYTDKMGALRVLYTWEKQLRGWHVRRVRQRRTSKSLGRTVVITRWQIRGFLALKDQDQTEKVMDDLVDDIIAAFAADEDLDGVVSDTVVNDEAGIQLEDSGPVRFADVLCHGVRLALNTEHLE